MPESQLEEHEPLLRPSGGCRDNSSVPNYTYDTNDTPLTYDALTAPDITYTLVQPLVEKYLAIQNNGNASVVFCLLLNRVHFLRDDNILTATISQSRATLCEILAIRTFRAYANNMLQLTRTLTTTWLVYNGADPQIIQQARAERDDDLEDRVGNAIEMAILGKSKRFIKSSSCQKVINAIWTGRCVYQAESSHSILADTYKRTPIHFYDPHKAPLLDHYRLKVPAIRSVLEYTNFLLLFILFIVAIEVSDRDKLDAPEIIFMVYGLGFTLEKVAAMQEHGIKVYFKGTWIGIRDFERQPDGTISARYDGAIRCFDVYCRILLLRVPLCPLDTESKWSRFARYSVGTISWWMLDIWFGLDASGFDQAARFHPIFGPVLMVTYACLSNTLLLTVLVSILSNTFATINEDAAAEAMFRKAVSTIEGITSFPILLLISAYERQSKKNGTANFYETVGAVAEKVFDALPRQLKKMSKIFEIEEEFESALDINDTASYQVHERPRRMSSGPAQYNQTPAGPTGSIPHTRLTSIMHRGGEAAQSFTSPLAQVFQPLIVDNTIPEEPGDKTESSPASPGATGPIPFPSAVSYGSASRRRLSSVYVTQGHPQSSPPLFQQVQAKKVAMFPKSSSPPRSSAFSRSPERIAPASPSTATEALEESKADEVGRLGGVAVERRLEEMEKRQERIEELLKQIARDVRH
ncbi:hypothetical protein H0H87_003892 [Tephrocybe sp. NHM501043]|nr:hypothetical protein H0H87_003892 [Tephrocybe sp. NHM501043]